MKNNFNTMVVLKMFPFTPANMKKRIVKQFQFYRSGTNKQT